MSAATRTSPPSYYPGLKWPVVISVLFHVAVIVGGTLSLPYLKKPPIVASDPIPVEIITEVTQTNKPPVKSRGEDKKSPPKQKKRPAPPKVTAKEMPKTVPLEAPKPIEKKVEKATSDVPMPEVKKLEKPPPKKPKPKEVVQIDNQEAFLSVLKNLQDSDPQVAVMPEALEAQPEMSPLARFAQRMTMSEADALRRQLAQCWSIQVGARYAEDLVVEVKLVMNSDRSIRQATIVDKGRYNRDSFFKAAADSAMRAIRSPMCDPLDLPPEKYDLWKDIVVSFDPREML